MTNDVSCHAGKCYEVNKRKSNWFSNMFESDSIVGQIERDLWKDSMYGN